MDNRLMVFVRVKPTNTNDERTIIDIVDDESLVFDPIDAENEPTNEYYYHGKKFKSIGGKRNKNCTYTFDRVFGPHATNYNVYETVAKQMVEATIGGVNSCIFCYGQTGSGKSYTMLGKPRNDYTGEPGCPGVIYYTSKELFGKLATISEIDFEKPMLRIAFFEIYNERIRDLLVVPPSHHQKEPNYYVQCGPKRLRTTPERCRARQQLLTTTNNYNLPVCEAPNGESLVIPDLSYHTPSNAEELIDLLEMGNTNRSQHPTDANADSSRSHAIFQIVLTRRTRGHGANSSEYQLQTSKMSLIDLAGSERASVAYRAGNDRSKNLQREGGNINKSLLALGNCINALADPGKGHRHIPYRNSKLTRLLRDSLGGKCRTAMIATICQQPNHYDDTQNTLVYASRATCIKLKPGRNFTNVAIQPKNYNLIIDNQNKQLSSLQSENDKLKFELAELKNEYNAFKAQKKNSYQLPQIQSPNQQSASQFLNESQFRQELEDLYEERRAFRLDILKYESKLRMNELKLVFKRLDDERQQAIHGRLTQLSNNNNTTNIQIAPITSSLNLNDPPQALKTQSGFFEQERKTLLDKARMNELHIQDTIQSMTTEFHMKDYGTPEEFDTIIEPFITQKELIQELEEKKFCEQHAYDLAQLGINRLINSEDLLKESAHIIRYTQAIIKGRGLGDGLSDPLDDKISMLFKKLEGKKSVVWKDDKYAMENGRDNEPLSQLFSVHENFSLNFLTPFKNNNTIHSRRISRNLVSLSNYTPEQSYQNNNMTFDASQ